MLLKKLTKTNVSPDDYQAAKLEYESRKLLPETDARRMTSMLDWLKHYNCLDTMPLVEALSTSFGKFHEYFDVDPNMALI